MPSCFSVRSTDILFYSICILVQRRADQSGTLRVFLYHVSRIPILTSIGSYNHECAAWVFEILTPLQSSSSYSYLSASDKIMASLDVQSLFTNVPVNFAIDLVLKSVFFNNIAEFHGLTKFRLEKLRSTSKGTVFRFNRQLFE